MENMSSIPDKLPLTAGTPIQSVISGDSDSSSVNSLFNKLEKSENERKKSAKDAVEKIEGLQFPAAPQLKESPDPKNFNHSPMDSFGSGATWLATFGSLLTRRPFVNSLNSASAVMKAYQAQDTNSFHQAMDKWKLDTENAKIMHDYQMELYKDMLNKPIEEQKILAAASKDETTKMAIEGKFLQQQLHALKVNGEKFEQSKSVIDYVDAKEDQARKSGMTDEQILLNKPKWFGEALSGIKGTSTESALDPETTDRLAKQYISTGDPTVLTQAVRGRGKDAQVTLSALEQKVTELMTKQGLPPEEMTKRKISLAGAMAEARKIGTTSGGIEFAANSLDQSLPVLEDAIKKIDMSQFKDINSWDNFVNRHTGDPDIVALDTALQATKSDYSTLIARNGVRSVETDRKSDELVNSAFAKKQFGSFINQVRKEQLAQKKASKISQQNVGNWSGGLSVNPPNTSDIKMLLDNPSNEMKNHFDEAFGKGSANKVLNEKND